jgi:hypothetical protein
MSPQFSLPRSRDNQIKTRIKFTQNIIIIVTETVNTLGSVLCLIGKWQDLKFESTVSQRQENANKEHEYEQQLH